MSFHLSLSPPSAAPCCSSCAGEPAVGPDVESEVAWPAALPLLGIGPLLFLQALVFQNQGWIAQVAGLSPAAAFVLTMMGNLVLAAGVWTGLARPYALRPLTAFLGIAGLGLSASVATKITPAFSFNVVIAQFVFGWSLAAIAMATAPPTTGGMARTSVSLNTGMLVFLGLTFAYYVSLDLPLPVSRYSPLPAAAVAFGLTVVAATVRLPVRGLPRSASAFIAVAGVFLPVVVFSLVQPDLPAATSPTGAPLRVLTYNIHSAYDSAGAQDPEAIARVIEATGADIVALQEVSRGWVLDGSTDLVAWLAQRLDMQVLFAGTTDPVWGNALLRASRSARAARRRFRWPARTSRAATCGRRSTPGCPSRCWSSSRICITSRASTSRGWRRCRCCSASGKGGRIRPARRPELRAGLCRDAVDRRRWVGRSGRGRRGDGLTGRPLVRSSASTGCGTHRTCASLTPSSRRRPLPTICRWSSAWRSP